MKHSRQYPTSLLLCSVIILVVGSLANCAGPSLATHDEMAMPAVGQSPDPAIAAVTATALVALKTIESALTNQTPATALTTEIPTFAVTPVSIESTIEVALNATLTALSPTNTPILTATLSPTPNLAATQTTEENFMATSVAATLTAQPQPTATHTPLPVRQVVAYRTDEATLQNLSSLWSLTSFRDLATPGIQTYNVSVTSRQDWRWTFAWCAIDSSTLREILQPLTVTMLIDDMALSTAAILQHQGLSNNRDQCYYWSTALTDWQPGAVVKLEMRYSLTTAIYDGRQSYPAGEYEQVMFVNVR